MKLIVVSAPMSSRALTIESLPNYADFVKRVVDGFRTTQTLIEDHAKGNTQGIRTSGSSSISSYLKYHPGAPRELFSPQLLEEGDRLEDEWKKLTDEHLSGLGKGSAADIRKMISSDDRGKQRQAVDLLDRALTLTGQDPRALPILRRQAVYEKDTLSIVTPYYREICPSRVKNPRLGFYAHEPSNLEGAIAEVQDFQRMTAVNLARYQTQNLHSTQGGFGETFLLMRMDGFFASLTGPWLMKKARQLQQELREKEEVFLMEAVRKRGGIVNHENVDEVIRKWIDSAQDDTVRLANYIQLCDPWSVKHFQRQTRLGEKLRANLEGRKRGEVFPIVQNRYQARNLVEISLEWTRITAVTISAQDFRGWKGGFAWLYQWLAREDSKGYMGQDLLEEGRKIGQDWQGIKRDNIRLAFRQTLGIDLGGIDPDDVILRLYNDIKARSISSDIAIRAAELLYFNPRVLEHLNTQAQYEQKLLKSL